MNWEGTYREFIEKDDLGNPDEELRRLEIFIGRMVANRGERGRMISRHFRKVLEKLTRDDMIEVAGMITLLEEIFGIKY